MNRALARPRIYLSILQALLGLILLAWLPAIDGAASETSFLIQLEETLLLTDPSDSGESGQESFSREWSDGEGSSGALVPTNAAYRSLGGMKGQGNRFGLQQSVDIVILESLRATGPPRL
jgi:hypothetical protein